MISRTQRLRWLLPACVMVMRRGLLDGVDDLLVAGAAAEVLEDRAGESRPASGAGSSAGTRAPSAPCRACRTRIGSRRNPRTPAAADAACRPARPVPSMVRMRAAGKILDALHANPAAARRSPGSCRRRTRRCRRRSSRRSGRGLRAEIRRCASAIALGGHFDFLAVDVEFHLGSPPRRRWLGQRAQADRQREIPLGPSR